MTKEEKLLDKVRDLSKRADMGLFEKMEKAIQMAKEWFGLNPGGVQSCDLVKCLDEAIEALNKLGSKK